jgi:hypothetical protein
VAEGKCGSSDFEEFSHNINSHFHSADEEGVWWEMYAFRK